jgi:hypothetical protein
MQQAGRILHFAVCQGMNVQIGGLYASDMAWLRVADSC